MEKYYRQTIGLPVMEHSGAIINRIRDIIINTENGKIVGFFVMGGATKVIAPSDIIDWDSTIVIHDSEDIVEAEEVLSIQKVIEEDMKLIKKKVVTQSGEYIGKVLDFGINNKFFELTVIVVAKSFLGLIFWDKKIISSKEIIEIKPEKVIVKDLVSPIKMEKFQVDMASS